jgi:hypothetical protein
MSVLNTQYDRPYSPPLHESRKCSTCGGKLSYPFVCWESGDYMCICGKCCQTIKDGLTADLIQVAATWDMRALRRLSDCNEITLVRSRRRDLEVTGFWSPETEAEEAKIVSIKEADE